MKYSVLFGCAGFGMLGAVACASTAPIDYPETKKVDVVDVYHGVEVADITPGDSVAIMSTPDELEAVRASLRGEASA